MNDKTAKYLIIGGVVIGIAYIAISKASDAVQTGEQNLNPINWLEQLWNDVTGWFSGVTNSASSQGSNAADQANSGLLGAGFGIADDGPVVYTAPTDNTSDDGSNIPSFVDEIYA